MPVDALISMLNMQHKRNIKKIVNFLNEHNMHKFIKVVYNNNCLSFKFKDDNNVEYNFLVELDNYE